MIPCNKPVLKGMDVCRSHKYTALSSGLVGPRIPCSETDCLLFSAYFLKKLCKKHYYKKLYNTNSEFRLRHNAKVKERMANDEYRAKYKNHQAKRYKTNLEWRDKFLKRHYNYCKTSGLQLHRLHRANRRSKLLKATPKWANLDSIKAIYKNCPEGHEVDHIIPLQGKHVSGLHVEYNLQYLTVTENRRKHNKAA